jgi:nucleotide-binding universal stress UspA family protein
MGGTIVCGVTGTAAARDASELAAALATRLGLRLVLVHVSGARPAAGPARNGDVRVVHGTTPAQALAAWRTRRVRI